MYPRESCVIVDIQFLHGNNGQKFAKEICFLECDSIVSQNYFLRPPFSWNELNPSAQRINIKCFKDVTKLKWNMNEDSTEYRNLKKLISQNCGEKTILVFPEEKRVFLGRFTKNHIRVLEDMTSFPDLQSFKHNCVVHNENFSRCSKHHVHQMQMYLEKENLIK